METSEGTFRGEYLVVALGAEKHPDALPGFDKADLERATLALFD